MALDRNKIAQQAEKLVAQGKIDAAISEYERLVKDNPRDMITINKIGDLYSRAGKKKEAIVQFDKIGEFYAKDGFFLKAIAIYKKIMKLDPSHAESCHRLADLYAKQGLTLEAKSQYKMVVDRYVRVGVIDMATSALQSLVKLDPGDLNSRRALAELLARNGKADSAVEEYTRIGAELEERGEHKEARAAYEKAAGIKPGSSKLVGHLSDSRLAQGDPDGARELLTEALRESPDAPDLLSMLGELELKEGRHAKAIEAFERALKAAPDRHELRLALARSLLGASDPEKAFESISAHLAILGKGETASPTARLLQEIADLAGSPRPALESLLNLLEDLKDAEGMTAAGTRLFEILIDEDDLTGAERVTERLGRLRPEVPGVAEMTGRLREARASRTPGGSAVEDELESAKPPTFVAPGEEEFDIDPPDIGSGDASTDVSSQGVNLSAPLELDPEDEDFITEHMTEADVFVKYGLADRAVEQLAAVIERFPAHVPARMRLKEIFLEEGNRERAREEMVHLVKAHVAAGDRLAAEETLAELGRLDPDCPEAASLRALLDPGESVEMPEQASPVPEPAPPEQVDEATGAEEEEIVIAEEMEEETTAGPSEEQLEGVDAHLQAGRSQEAVEILRSLAGSYGNHPEILSRMKRAVDLTRTEQPRQQHATAAAGATSPDGMEDLMDLASEIDAALAGSDDSDSALVTGEDAEPEGHSLEEIVEAFKKGIEHQIDSDDYDTHYNLGIAYKEMGLLDEAIGEFQFAAKGPALLLDCCSMLGLCFREKGMSPLAVKWYRRGLESDSPPEDKVMGLRYDLADLLEQMGQHRDALEMFTEIYGTDSKYRDVADRVKQLQGMLGT